MIKTNKADNYVSHSDSDCLLLDNRKGVSWSTLNKASIIAIACPPVFFGGL
jgi:hypothetical protein